MVFGMVQPNTTEENISKLIDILRKNANFDVAYLGRFDGPATQAKEGGKAWYELPAGTADWDILRPPEASVVL